MIYDFLIIGGGIAGASAAYELSSHGSVLLLEAEDTTGYHATGRSAALFTRNYGGETVRQINAISADFFRSPPPGFCEAPLLTKRGCLTVAQSGDEGELDALLAMSSLGEEVVHVDTKEACEMVPFLRPERVMRAVYEANVSDIDVATLHSSYLKGAKARGAVVMVKQCVTTMGRMGANWHVQTAKSSFSAAKVINAAGAWADQIGTLAGTQTIGLVPKKRTAIIISAPENTNCAVLPAVDFAGSDAYLKPDAGLLMASPGDATPTNPHDVWPDDMDIAVLADWIERETTIKVTKIEHSWAGLRSFVDDEAPVVGFDAQVPDFFWLAGQGGYGIMMAPILAQLTADLCTGNHGTHVDQLAQLLSPSRVQ
ncbi:NAD(P)/FAD-dependent oxidoreductase [Sulfitobacter sp.]|uniref:NAD(P)/FAD-dependent oxidoreductase n=1 Tax=Sulfitobacter sp. TaxID=1903071 RepID=UPI003001019D